jgi:hypothetical protein
MSAAAAVRQRLLSKYSLQWQSTCSSRASRVDRGSALEAAISIRTRLIFELAGCQLSLSGIGIMQRDAMADTTCSQLSIALATLFGRAVERITEVQNCWTYVRGTLEDLEEENITIGFLRHALIATKGYIREAQVYESMQSPSRASKLQLHSHRCWKP